MAPNSITGRRFSMNLNDKQRMRAVKRWARYVVNNKDWSRQQQIFIDAQIRNARAIGLSKEQVAYIQGWDKAEPRQTRL